MYQCTDLWIGFLNPEIFACIDLSSMFNVGWPRLPRVEVKRNDNAVRDGFHKFLSRLAERAGAEASPLIQPKFKPVDRQV